MSLPEQIREAAAAGDLARAARHYRDWARQAAGQIQACDRDPALVQEALDLLNLAREKRAELRQTLKARLQETRVRAYVAARYR